MVWLCIVLALALAWALRSRAAARRETLSGLSERHIELKKEVELLEKKKDEEQKKIDRIEEQAEMISFGFYQMRYDFGSADEYKVMLDINRAQQQESIKRGTAAYCSVEWTVGGSKRDGKKMIKDQLKLLLRAFNGECDAAVMRVKYNNISMLEKRIRTDFEEINKLGKVNQSKIAESFLKLKLEELALVHEYQVKKQEEIEEQRQIREQMKEEERALREIKKAQEDAEKEERRYQEALGKAQKEAEAASGKVKETLEKKIAELQEKLAQVQAKERALSQAQLTTSGHVYIISNIGSFGEGVYKIGMTRRLDPMERVQELGDASVPFAFDVHALLYTRNAPELERKLHKAFDSQRVNLVNQRKEFFRVSLDQIENAARKLNDELPKEQRAELRFTKLAAAEEYRQTIAKGSASVPSSI
jgi:hypothetical protein